MLLTSEQNKLLRRFIKRYSYPCVTYDFMRRRECAHRNMMIVERVIHRQLISSRLDTVKDGLSNVLYWGHARAGYRGTRVCKFREGISTAQLEDFVTLLREQDSLCPSDIRRCNLPQFSGLAFISKMLMFSDPERFVVLDSKIASLREVDSNSLFAKLVVSTTIRPTKYNDRIYDRWCRSCMRVGEQLGVRGVDVERSIFHMVESGRRVQASNICRCR